MPKNIRQTLFEPIALNIRDSSLRTPTIKRLLLLDNFLKRWITFFSFENNLHVRHRITNYHQFFLDNVESTDRVLDIGCGIGYLAADLAVKAHYVTGVDCDPASLAVARKNHQRDNLVYILGDATTYDFPNQFDIVVLSNVLEHIEDRVALLRKIKSLANKALIRVPMLDRDWIVLLKKELNVEHRLDPTHFTEYTEQSFRKELAQVGLSIESLSIRFGELYCITRST